MSASSSSNNSSPANNNHDKSEKNPHHQRRPEKDVVDLSASVLEEEEEEEESDGVDCGEKFRSMLKCVERTGDISVCTRKINAFLACERAVFHAALRTDPRRTPTITIQPQPHPSSPHSNHRHSNHHNDHEVIEFHIDLASIPDAFRRAIAKQSEACQSMAKTLVQTDNPKRIWAFCGRIMQDVGLSVTALSSKTASVIRDLFGGGNGRDREGKDGL